MLQNLTDKLEDTLRPVQQAAAAQHVERLLQALGQTPPIYGHVEVTYLAGKLTKIEKRESFKP